MSNGQWYPPEWPDRIRALAAGELTPVTPRRAATVMLLRDTAAGPAVHMLRRRASMAFAGGAYAYPGGGVDPRDDDRQVALGRPHAREVGRAARRRRRPPPRPSSARPSARRTRRRASCSPGRPPDTVVGDTTGDDWEADRAALVARELSFAEFLDRRGLVLRSDLLGRLGALDHPGVRAAPLRHLVLRRRAPGGPAHPQRLHRGRPHGVDPPRRTPPTGTTRASC